MYQELTKKDLINRLKQLVIAIGTQKQVARSLRVSPQYLSDVLKGRRNPGNGILRELGVKQKTVYYQKMK